MSLELGLSTYEEFTQLAVSVEKLQYRLHDKFLAISGTLSYCDTDDHDRILIEELFWDSWKSWDPAFVWLMLFLFKDWEEKEIEKQLKECDD